MEEASFALESPPPSPSATTERSPIEPILRCNIHRVRGIRTAASIFVEARLQDEEFTVTTSQSKPTRFPIWDQALELPLEELDKVAVVSVYARTDSHFMTPRKELLASRKRAVAEVPSVGDISMYTHPLPEWWVLAPHNEEGAAVHMLVSFQVFLPTAVHIPRPLTLEIGYADRKYLEIMILGLRELVPLPTWGISQPTITSSRVTIHVEDQDIVLPCTNNDDPYNPNVLSVVLMPLKLAHHTRYWPYLLLDIQQENTDTLTAGATPWKSIGEVEISLASQLIQPGLGSVVSHSDKDAHHGLAGLSPTHSALYAPNGSSPNNQILSDNDIIVELEGTQTSSLVGGGGTATTTKLEEHLLKLSVDPKTVINVAPPSDNSTTGHQPTSRYTDPLEEHFAKPFQDFTVLRAAPNNPAVQNNTTLHQDYKAEMVNVGTLKGLIRLHTYEAGAFNITTSTLPPTGSGNSCSSKGGAAGCSGSNSALSSATVLSRASISSIGDKDKKHKKHKKTKSKDREGTHDSADGGWSITSTSTTHNSNNGLLDNSIICPLSSNNEFPVCVQPFLPSLTFTKLNADNFTQKKWVLRLYIYRATGLVPSYRETSLHPYIVVEVPEETQTFPPSSNENKHVWSKIAGTTSPEFGHVFDCLTVSLPGTSHVTISVYDRDVSSVYNKTNVLSSSDTLIGSTRIDLENRLFSPQIMNSPIKHTPLERRTLWSPISDVPQGKLDMSLQILSLEQAKANPPMTIHNSVGCTQFELRLSAKSLMPLLSCLSTFGTVHGQATIDKNDPFATEPKTFNCVLGVTYLWNPTGGEQLSGVERISLRTCSSSMSVGAEHGAADVSVGPLGGFVGQPQELHNHAQFNTTFLLPTTNPFVQINVYDAATPKSNNNRRLVGSVVFNMTDYFEWCLQHGQETYHVIDNTQWLNVVKHNNAAESSAVGNPCSPFGSNTDFVTSSLQPTSNNPNDDVFCKLAVQMDLVRKKDLFSISTEKSDALLLQSTLGGGNLNGNGNCKRKCGPKLICVVLLVVVGAIIGLVYALLS